MLTAWCVQYREKEGMRARFGFFVIAEDGNIFWPSSNNIRLIIWRGWAAAAVSNQIF